MCRVVSDPTHLCRIGVGWVSVGVGSDTFVSDWCRIGVGSVSDRCRIGVGSVNLQRQFSKKTVQKKMELKGKVR